MRRFLPEIFILSVAVSLSFVGYVLVDTNKDSLGIISVTTFIGVIVMAVSLKIAGFLLGAKKAHANGKFYGGAMDWAMLLFVWPSYVTPLVIAPHLVGETPKIFSLFIEILVNPPFTLRTDPRYMSIVRKILRKR